MAGEDVALSGWRVYFNTQTISGRRNVRKMVVCFMKTMTLVLCVQLVLGTWGFVFGIYYLNKMRKRSKTAPKAIADAPSTEAK